MESSKSSEPATGALPGCTTNANIITNGTNTLAHIQRVGMGRDSMFFVSQLATRVCTLRSRGIDCKMNSTMHGPHHRGPLGATPKTRQAGRHTIFCLRLQHMEETHMPRTLIPATHRQPKSRASLIGMRPTVTPPCTRAGTVSGACWPIAPAEGAAMGPRSVHTPHRTMCAGHKRRHMPRQPWRRRVLARANELAAARNARRANTGLNGKHIWRGAAVLSYGMTLIPTALPTIQHWEIAHHEQDCF